MKIILSIFLFCTSILVTKANTINIKKNVRFMNTEGLGLQIINSIIDLDKSLEGYLFFELQNMKNLEDTNKIHLNILYSDFLNDFGMKDLIILNLGNEIALESGIVGINDSIENNFRLIWKCLKVFNSVNSKNCEAFSFRYWNEFNTNLLGQAILVERNKKKYFIFRIKLVALVYEYFVKMETFLYKTFIPISNLEYFVPVDIDTLENYGFKKSRITITFY